MTYKSQHVADTQLENWLVWNVWASLEPLQAPISPVHVGEQRIPLGSEGETLLDATESGTRIVLITSDSADVELRASNWREEVASNVVPWYSQAISELQAIQALGNNWNGYGAQAPSKNATAHAETVLSGLARKGLRVISIVPTSEGVAMQVGTGEVQAAIECDNEGGIGSLVVAATGEVIDGWDWDLGGDEGMGLSFDASVRRLEERLK